MVTLNLCEPAIARMHRDLLSTYKVSKLPNSQPNGCRDDVGQPPQLRTFYGDLNDVHVTPQTERMQGGSGDGSLGFEDLTARFAARLRELQRSAGLSERELARASDLGATTVRRLLAGEAEPRLSTMVALAGALNLASLEQFLAPFATEMLTDRVVTASSRRPVGAPGSSRGTS